MLVLALYGSFTPGTQRLCNWVERAASELGISVRCEDCADTARVERSAAEAGYRVLPLDDAAVGVAALLSERMPRPLLDAAPRVLEDKWGQRDALSRHGLPVPPFRLVETESDVRECGRSWGFPLMVKPARGTRSQGVHRVDGPGDVVTALSDARLKARASGLERVLAEGYIDGVDVAVESIVVDGVTHHVSFWQSGWNGDMWQAATPLAPALLPQLADIGEAVSSANKALGLRWAATSNELRVTRSGPVIVEVNARLGGEPCEDAIVLHNGVDRVRAMLTMLTGRKPDIAPRFWRPVVQTTIRATAGGVVRSISPPPSLTDGTATRLMVDIHPGTRIDDPSSHYLGWLLMGGDQGDDAEVMLPRAAAWGQLIQQAVHMDEGDGD